MKVFITGISGFIGFHLSCALAKKDIPVMGCDAFTSFHLPLKKRRAAALKAKGIKVLPLNIDKMHELSGLFKEQRFTHIVHLAAQAGVRYSIENPQRYIDANITGLVHLLEFCRLFDLTLLFASSSSVYGNSLLSPFKETQKTDQPVSFYAATKKSGEVIAYSYHHLYAIPMIGLRFFTVYGPLGRPDMAYFAFAEKIMKKVPIPVFNHGKCKRDFTYISDIVDGIIGALLYSQKHTGFDIFNLGNHKQETLLSLIRCLETSLGEEAKLNYLPMQQGDVESTFADIEKSQKLLGFSPKVSLCEGIEKFADWFLSQPSTRRAKPFVAPLN